MSQLKSGQIGIQLIFAANIIQSSWWIILALQIYQPISYLLCFFQLTSLLLKMVSYILIKRKQGLNIIVHIATLLSYVLQIESLQLLIPTNHLHTFSISLLTIVTYNEYLNIAIQKFSLICKLGLPLYLIIRVTWVLIECFSIFIIECLITIIMVTIYFILKNQTQFNQNFSKNLIDQSLKNNYIKESPLISYNQQIQSQIKSQSKISNIPSAKNSFSLLRDLPGDQKLLQYSNLTSISKSQPFNKFFEKSDQQILLLYQNLINLYPYGILIINQQQQIIYINNKSEKILECQGAEVVLEKIKICVNNARIEETISESSKSLQNQKQRKLIHYDTLRQIVGKLQSKNLSIDIFDIILQPAKYQGILSNEDQLNKDNYQKIFHKQIFIYEWLFQSNFLQENSQKKVKLIIIPTTMTSSQQEYFTSPSQIKFSSKSFPFSNEQDSPVLLIIIKNLTNKHNIQYLKDKQIIHHSLIKSFSHELRTPLNSCQQMLTLMKNSTKTEDFTEELGIAQCSISLLIHQINDILDYAAIQSYQFSYHITPFTIDQLIQEIDYLYKLQMQSKKIKFMIKVQQCLMTMIISNDKQRILQILVNLLSNAIKFTQEGGTIDLNLKQCDNSYINVKIKDSGIGIKEHRLNLILNSLHDTQEFGATLKSNANKNPTGLGLIIAAKLVKGLTDDQDNQLVINSKNNKGTVIQFQIQNFQQNNLLSSNPLSQQTVKFNQSGIQYTFSERKLEDPKLIKSSHSNFKIDNDEEQYQDQKSDSYNNTSRLNDKEMQSGIFLPVSPNYFSNQFIQSNEYLKQRQEIQIEKVQNQLCKNCVHVLIVDDIPFNQMTLKLNLNHYQIKADQAFDGFQAIEKVKNKFSQHCQTYKLIFMDIEMPGIDGFQASKQILELTNQQSIIVICSAYDTQENFEHGNKIGINLFLSKPVKQEELEVLLKMVFKITII
ncbi:unnamed protein product [Paramecium pentaurelia]|uniref:Uncharacterized protein n=1 Tax=Paramecium pentaurelia TaxID=43138 RepID=A0A8S1VYC6_9CILI|nr:unnamed protein product [Paramecium pentaurelia]